jgi:hypothetical protein
MRHESQETNPRRSAMTFGASNSPSQRIAKLERQIARQRIALTAVILLCTATVFAGWTFNDSNPDVLRARILIIEDEQGRSRIMIGAPLPALLEGGRELPPRIGMVINDSVGFERWGLSLDHRGSIGMGFDAPPGTGDDRNRERINIWADERGGATIRFLDRRTHVPARMYLDEENRVWLEFLEFSDEMITRRRLGFTGDEVIETPRGR